MAWLTQTDSEIQSLFRSHSIHISTEYVHIWDALFGWAVRMCNALNSHTHSYRSSNGIIMMAWLKQKHTAPVKTTKRQHQTTKTSTKHRHILKNGAWASVVWCGCFVHFNTRHASRTDLDSLSLLFVYFWTNELKYAWCVLSGWFWAVVQLFSVAREWISSTVKYHQCAMLMFWFNRKIKSEIEKAQDQA